MVHMAFGGKVDHGIVPIGLEGMLHNLCITDVSMHENMPRIAGQQGHVFGITRIGELVQIDNRIPDRTSGKDITGADEPRTAGNKDGCHKIFCSHRIRLRICLDILNMVGLIRYHAEPGKLPSP